MAGGFVGRLVLELARNPAMSSFATRSSLAAPLVRRFVAGDSLDEVVRAARELSRRGLLAALDPLGENTTSPAGASAAARMAVETLDRISRERLDAYLSLKLTQLGLDLGHYLVLAHTRTVLLEARAHGLFVRFDMEGSTYTARTLGVVEELHRQFDNVGAVIQAYLYRSAEDARRLSAQSIGIRLCKGAYDEPPHIAFRRKQDTDRNYVRLMEYLLLHGTAPAFATHDPAIIEQACSFAERNHIAVQRFAFEMLFGVRRDLQEQLVRRGYTVRIYVPFGSQWYPYMTRRLAERPSNLLSIAGSIARERAGSPRSASRPAR